MRSAPTARPLLDLPPVPLPPPTGPVGRGRSLALRAALSLVLLGGVFLLAVGIVAALVFVNVLIFRAGRVQVGLAILPFVVAFALLRGLAHAVRRPPEPDDEVEVPATEEPDLHAEVRRLAEAAGTRPPDRVVVVPEVNAYVREFGPLLGLLPGTRTLAVGTPLLDALDVSELRSVLGHELGHLAGGDTRLGPLAYRTDAVLVRTIESLRGGSVSGIFVAYWKLQRRVSASVRRGQELVADRVAVRVGGRQAAADALRDVEVAARADALFKGAYLVPLLRTGHRPDDLAAGWRSILAEPEQVAELAAAAEADASPIDPWASHPPTHERIRRVAAIADEADVERDPRPASSLLRDPERWVRAAAERWMSVVGVGAGTTVVPWSAWGEVVARGEQAARAAVVDQVLVRLGLPQGVEGVQEALAAGRDRELAAGLVSAGWRVGGPDERTVVLRAAVVATAAERAAAAGATWTVSWSGPVALIAPDGATLDLDRLADGALAGDWDGLLAAVGSPPSAAAPAASPGPRRARGRQLHHPTASDEPTVTPGRPAPAPPTPPSPPFAPAEHPWRWTATVPGRIGSKVRVHVGDDHLGLGDAVIAYADIAHLATRIQNQNGVDATITVEADGATEPIKVRASSVGAQGQAIVQLVAYLWDLLDDRIGEQRRADVVAAVQGGDTVVVAGLSLSRAGVATAKRPARVTPWAQTGDPYVDQLAVKVPTSGKPLAVGIGSSDAYLLSGLLPVLRTMFA